MSFTNQTTHYGLPQWIGSDKPTYLVDQNNAYQTIDSELYNANTASGEAVTTAQGAVTTAEGAASTAATALSTAQGAETTANTADGKADNAITLAQSAQTAAGAAQTAAEAAQTAAAGNSITNLANAYDPTLTYNVGDLVTQDGKLYQCITQVSAPEAFDINKWDDKTVSEVAVIRNNTSDYAFKTRTYFDIPANTYTSLADALNWIHANVATVFNLNTNQIAKNIELEFPSSLGFITPVKNVTINPNTSTLDVSFSKTVVTSSIVYQRYVSVSSNSTIYDAATDNSVTTISNLSSGTQTEIRLHYDLFQLI